MAQSLVLQGKTEEAESLIHNAFILAEHRLRKEGVVRMSNEKHVIDDETAELFTHIGAAFSLIGRTSYAKKSLETALQIQRRGGSHQRDPSASCPCPPRCRGARQGHEGGGECTESA